MVRRMSCIHILCVTALTVIAVGCSHNQVAKTDSVENRVPASAGDRDAKREQAEAKWLKKKAIRELQDYTLSDEFISSANEIMARQFMDALVEIDTKSDGEIRSMLLAESKRMDDVLAQHSAELDNDTKKVIENYQAELQKLAASDSPKEKLREATVKSWKAAGVGLSAMGASLVYADFAITGAAGLPLTMATKFIYGAIKGNKLDRDKNRDSMFGDREGGGLANVILSPFFSTMILFVANPTNAMGQVFGISVLNFVVYAVVFNGVCDSWASPRTERFCNNALKIQEFFSRVSDKAAYAGADFAMLITKVGPVLRKKDVVSTKVCKRENRSMRVANRVMVRHEDAIKALPGVQAVSVGTSANHPVSNSCGSLVVKMKPGFEADDVSGVFGHVIDGVYVDYVQ